MKFQINFSYTGKNIVRYGNVNFYKKKSKTKQRWLSERMSSGNQKFCYSNFHSNFYIQDKLICISIFVFIIFPLWKIVETNSAKFKFKPLTKFTLIYSNKSTKDAQ